LVLTALCFFLFRLARYAYATAFITAFTLCAFTLLGEASVNIALSRILCTLIGCLIAFLAVNFIWPDWKFARLSHHITRLYEDNRHYLQEIIQQYQQGKNNHV